MSIVINGVSVEPLHDLALRAGLTTESVRKRIQRGRIDLKPFARIGPTDLYRVSDARKLAQKAIH